MLRGQSDRAHPVDSAAGFMMATGENNGQYLSDTVLNALCLVFHHPYNHPMREVIFLSPFTDVGTKVSG